MNSSQYYISVAVGAVCLILSIISIALGRSNQQLQSQVQALQAQVQQGNFANQVGRNVLTDLGNLSVKNSQIKELLAKHGYTVTQTPAPSAPSK